MGITRKPKIADHWKQKFGLFRSQVNTIMSRDRFQLIWRYLHLYDSELLPQLGQPDKLLKLRWLIEYLNKAFSQMYTTYGSVTIDESMVKFKGRLSFRQYLPSKPIKWGMKMWSLAESTNGYLHQFQIYTGKEGVQEKRLSHRVVTDLMKNMQDQNICVYMDNFYTGIELLKELKIRGIYACGIVRANRKGLPTELLPKKLKLARHEYRVAQLDDMSFCHWMDTKPVMILSNIHDPAAVGIVNRRSGHIEQRQVIVPHMLQEYQDNMRGVDLLDQMVAYYLINHRSLKWWRRLFFHLMTATAYNSYIVAQDSNPDIAKQQWPSFKDYLEHLCMGLIGDTTVQRDAPHVNEIMSSPQHTLKMNMYSKRRICVECKAAAGPGVKIHGSFHGCEQCGVALHLKFHIIVLEQTSYCNMCK